jgi:phosphoribosylformylglycinamidine synthase
MPHPERCVRTWQWPYLPSEWKSEYGTKANEYTAPWLKMFQNAKKFCDSV